MRLMFLEQVPRFVGGSERMSLALCQHAIARGHQAWLVYERDGDMVDAYRAAGADCRKLPVRPLAVRHPRMAWQSVASSADLVRRERIDVLFSSQINYASLMAMVGKSTRARTAMHLGLTYDYPSPVFKAGIRRIDLGIAPSAHTAIAWTDRGWPLTSIRVIPNGVDLTTFHPADGREAARKRLGLDGIRAPLVTYVGRLVREKGVFTLIKAFARYTREGGRAHLMVVGQPATWKPEDLGAVARQEGLTAGDWHQRPPTTHPEDVYRAADLVVVPSEWEEPFGLVPLEAMASGTPVIVSDRGLLPQFVAPLNGAAVFASGDEGALARRIASWLEMTPEARDRASEVLRSHVAAEFGFARCGDAYLEAFAR